MKKEIVSSSADENSKFCKNKLFLIMPIISLLLINLIYAGVRINEVELNPSGSDSGNEWIELYSDSLINLNGWKLVNHDNKVKTLNQSFNGYLVINFNEQWLDNENESIILYNGSSLVSITPVLKDSSNDNKTWNYCNDKWLFLNSSPGLANNCATQSNNTNNQTNQTNPNPPNNTTNPANSSSSSVISLNLDWNEDDIVNGEDFEITVKAYNLQDKEYDIKVSISNDSKVISQTYDENDKWVSSSEYYAGFFKGSGNKTEDITLRIKDTYGDFKGDATIIVRIREKGTSTYKKENQEDIEILKAKVSSTTNTNTEETVVAKDVPKSTINNPPDSETENIIKLGKTVKKTGTEDIKTSKNTIYQSKNELIKTYSIYFFAFLLIVLCVLLAIKKI